MSRHRYIKGDLFVGDALPFRLAAVRAACGCNGVSPSVFAVQPNIYHSTQKLMKPKIQENNLALCKSEVIRRHV